MEKLEPLDRRTHRPAADLFNHTDSVIVIDDLITDVEIQISTAHVGHPGKGLRGEAATVLNLILRLGEAESKE
jgi:hypothetical protein